MKDRKWNLCDGNNPLPSGPYDERRPIEMKFDNGEVRDYMDDWPFAYSAHWRYKEVVFTFDEIIEAGLCVIEQDGNLLNEEMLIKKLSECQK